MESKDVPQWVSQSFARSLANIGASASREEILLCCDELIRAWCAPGRFEHGLQHLIDMLSRVDILAPETPDPDLVRIATWFHGVVFSTADLDVYTRNGGEDERASAQIAEEKLTALGLPIDSITTVKKLILSLKQRGLELGNTALAHRAETQKSVANSTPNSKAIVFSETDKFVAIDMNQHALCDAHLGVLAAEPQRYRKYALRIREEYEHIPLTHFLSARIKIVQCLLNRKKLYISPLAAAWENTARQNLQVELEELTTQLTQARETQASLTSTQIPTVPSPVLNSDKIAAKSADKTLRSQSFGDAASGSEIISAPIADQLGSKSSFTKSNQLTETVKPNIPAEFISDTSKTDRVSDNADITLNTSHADRANLHSALSAPAFPEACVDSSTQNKNHAQFLTQANTITEKQQSTANLEVVNANVQAESLGQEQNTVSAIDSEAANEPYIEKNASRTSEFSTVKSVSGNTIVRKAPQSSLSSLEIFNDDFNPLHTIKSEHAPHVAEDSIKNPKQQSSAQKANMIKHRIETEPDF